MLGASGTEGQDRLQQDYFLFWYESRTALLLSRRLIETQAHSISCNRHLPYHILRRGGERKVREGGVSQSSNASSGDDTVNAITALPVWPCSKTHRTVWNGNAQLFNLNHVQVLHPAVKPFHLFPLFPSLDLPYEESHPLSSTSAPLISSCSVLQSALLAGRDMVRPSLLDTWQMKLEGWNGATRPWQLTAECSGTVAT